MTNNDQFCFFSPDFQSNISSAWKELQSDKDFCDVTLACDGKQIQTHKFILASTSPVLRKILKLNVNQHPIVYLMGVKYQVMQNLLKFMYDGEVNIAEQDVDSFFEVAENLKVRGLSEGNRYDLNYFNSKSENSNSSSKKIIAPPAKIKRPLEIENIVIKYNKSKPKLVKQSEGDGPFVEIGNEIQVENNYELADPQTYEAEDIADDVHFVESGNGIKTENNYEIAEQDSYIDYSGETNFDNYQIEPYQPYPPYYRHKKEKLYTCEKCDKQFTFKRALTRHVASIHDGMVVECDLCGKKFNQIDNLRRHKQTIHEGVRYNCELCDYKATKKEYLRTHNEKHHYLQYHSYQM